LDACEQNLAGRFQPDLTKFRKSLKLNTSSNSESTPNNIEGASQNTDINSQTQLHAKVGNPDTAAPENGASGHGREKNLDNLAKIQGWNRKDLEDAKFMHKKFKDVVGDDELIELIIDAYGCHEECEKWALKSALESYALSCNLVCRLTDVKLTREQKKELISVLWESRGNTPEEGPAVELETLQGLLELVTHAQVMFDELYMWKVDADCIV
jgi:hypothetical protein